LFTQATNKTVPTSNKMKAVFRKYYYQAFSLGKLEGGAVSLSLFPDLTLEDKRWVDSFLRKEFGFWKKFIDDISGGKGTLDYNKRLDMYVKTLRSAYISGKVLETPPNTVYYWEKSKAEHCPQCTYLAMHSPFTKANLPTIPGSGDTFCKSNCKCKMTPKTVSMLEYHKIAAGALPRDVLLRELRAAR
jgi:hypothetical protein